MSTQHAQNFPKAIRVVRGDDFTDIIRRGAFAADDVLVVNVRRASDPSGRTKLGVTIPKKTGNALVRNRWKRWIREAFRTQKDRFPAGLELIARPKRDAVGTFAEIRRSLVSTGGRAIAKLPRILPTDPPK